MKINLSRLMRKAWSLYRQAMKRAAISFSEALKRAWRWERVQAANAAIIEAAANDAGVDELYHTWAGWQALGRMVIHTEQAAFKVTVLDPLTKAGTRIQSFFTYEQTQVAPA